MSGSEQENYAQNLRAAQLNQRTEQIRALNDRLRQELAGGLVTITAGVEALGLIGVTAVLQAVRTFDDFSDGNDPHGEHDFGAFNIPGHRIFWKIDHYDRQLQYGSPDPTNPEVTTRVITVMLASEY